MLVGAYHARRTRWLIVCFAVLLVLVGLRSTFEDMVTIWWTSSTFNHCFLIVPIAIYLGMHRRSDLHGVGPSVSWAGLAFVLLNAAIWLAGWMVSVAFFQHVAAVGMIIGTSWALLGNQVFRILLLPFLYLYFAVPEGEFLVPMLQDWTAKVLVYALRLTGIPVFVEGRYLSIPSGNFVVAEACSGINYLVATLAVGTMFMYLNFKSPTRRIAFMVVAVIVPLVANGLRAYGIVMIAHLSNYRYALGIDHFIYGWVFFGVVIFALFVIGSRFSDIATEAAPGLPDAAMRAASGSPWILAMTVALVAGCAILPPTVVVRLNANRPLSPMIALPSVAGWVGPHYTTTSLDGSYAGRDAQLVAKYWDEVGKVVLVEINYFRAEGPDKELVNQVNGAFNVERWQQIDYGSRRPATGVNIDQVNEVRLRSKETGDEFLVWTWYDTNGRQSGNRLAIKLAQAFARLRGAHGGGAAITVATRQGRDEDGAKILNDFLHGNAFALQRLYVKS